SSLRAEPSCSGCPRCDKPAGYEASWTTRSAEMGASRQAVPADCKELFARQHTGPGLRSSAQQRSTWFSLSVPYNVATTTAVVASNASESHSNTEDDASWRTATPPVSCRVHDCLSGLKNTAIFKEAPTIWL